ncbi:hypothetical protein [Curtobacterium sp. Curtsp57]|uniref:hypothetical protein n=1 Tax=Curtobacterium sp. Curtsp57 TaxID=3243047 RepID=UPI0039B4DE33
MALTTKQAGSLSDRHASQRDSLIGKLLTAILQIWSGVSNYHDDDQVGSAAAASAYRVMQAQTQARRLVRSYQTSLLRALDALDTFPTEVTYYPRSGTTALDVYARPASQAIYAYSQGGTLEDARQAVEDRLELLLHEDIMLAERDEEQRIYEALPRVVGYRRVIHPERSKSGTCGLCAVAATQRYRTDELRPLHDGCECGSMPIVGTQDPGQVLNDEDLEQLYAAAGQAASVGGQRPAQARSTAREDLLNVRVQVNEHGEKGPVLVKQGDHFRTHSEAGAAAFQKPTPAVIRQRKQQARDQAAADLADARSRLQQVQASHANDGTATPREQVVLAQRVKNLSSLLRSLEADLSRSDS